MKRINLFSSGYVRLNRICPSRMPATYRIAGRYLQPIKHGVKPVWAGFFFTTSHRAFYTFALLWTETLSWPSGKLTAIIFVRIVLALVVVVAFRRSWNALSTVAASELVPVARNKHGRLGCRVRGVCEKAGGVGNDLRPTSDRRRSLPTCERKTNSNSHF